MDELPKLYTPQEVAEMIGYSRQRIYALIDRKQITPYKPLLHIRVLIEQGELDRILAMNKGRFHTFERMSRLKEERIKNDRNRGEANQC